MRTTIEFPADLFRKAKARAASQGESLKRLITRAVEAEVGQERRATKRGRVTLPLFGDPKARPANLHAADLARAIADEDAILAGRRRRR